MNTPQFKSSNDSLNGDHDQSSSEVDREFSSHGNTWEKMHGGYFSSPEIAEFLVGIVTRTIVESHPDTIVDLGGGTGFILDRVIKGYPSRNLKFFNLDLSREQLQSLVNNQIIPCEGSIAFFKREDLGKSNSKILFIARSALHYFGSEGLDPVINHISAQMRENEFFVHQTACFESSEDASLMNLIYKLIGTKKWYPSLKAMTNVLEKADFEIVYCADAPPLPLSSDSLMKRYNVDQNCINRIIDVIEQDFSEINEDVFKSSKNSFTAKLHYKVLSCRRK